MKGHLEKPYKSSWRIVIQLPKDPETGRQKRLVRSFRGTKTEAKEEMGRLIAELRQGTYVQPSKATLEEYLKTWLESRGAKLAPKTVEGYELYMRRHVVPYLGSKKLHAIQPIDIQNLYTELGKHLSQTTVQRVHEMLRAAFRHARRLRLIQYNPCEDVESPRPEKKETRALRAEEIPILLKAAGDSPIRDLITVALHTGARRGELLALKWKDVDFNTGIIYLRQNLTKVKGMEHVRLPKARRVRLQFLTATAKDLLERMKSTAVHDLVFCRDGGQALDPSTVTHQFAKVARKAGFPDLTLHGVRHTYASILHAEGVGIRYIQQALGHGSLAMTEGYTHVDLAILKAVAETFERAISHRFRTDSLDNGNSANMADPAMH